MHHALTKLNHRTWPIPDHAWTWRQSWCDLLFAHWPVPKKELEPLVPDGLSVQEFDSTSWVGIVPFRMQGVMRRPFPDLPWISAFPELNLRLYVERDGKPGVWFLSLDATNPLAVWAARRFFSLPYHLATMHISHFDEKYNYQSVRHKSGERFQATYAPVSPIYTAKTGTLEHWLTERYCLYAQHPDRTLSRTEVHHHPWSLQKAKADIKLNNLCEPHGIKLGGEPVLLHFSKKIDVVIWSPEKLSDKK